LAVLLVFPPAPPLSAPLRLIAAAALARSKILAEMTMIALGTIFAAPGFQVVFARLTAATRMAH